MEDDKDQPERHTVRDTGDGCAQESCLRQLEAENATLRDEVRRLTALLDGPAHPVAAADGHAHERSPERQTVDAALRASEERYRTVVERSPAGIILIDGQARIIFANAEACAILGRSRSEIEGSIFSEFLHPNSTGLVFDRYRRRQTGESVPSRYEIQVLRPNGEVRTLVLSAATYNNRAGMVRSVAQILDINERIQVELVPVDMRPVVGNVLQRLERQIDQAEAEVIKPSQWPKALGYAPWLEEVWANYISNALAYGGDPPRIKLGADVLGDGRVRYWVRDNGDGVPVDLQPMLFGEASHIDLAWIKGQGLRLSIAQRIVSKLGGEIGVESAGLPGQGSTFSFTLQAAPQTSRGSPHANAGGAPPPGHHPPAPPS